MSILRPTLCIMFLACLGACGGGGPYGFARSYVPLRGERQHAAREQQISYEDARRHPNELADVELGWFGVVTSYADLSDGRVRLDLSLRAHQERHLCSQRAESSCRVTVADRDLGGFVVELALRPEERTGRDRVWYGSLLKVYGTVSGKLDEEGRPILDVRYYRHFPRGTYVTTAERNKMRR